MSERERFEAAFNGDFQRDAAKPDEYWNTPTQCAWRSWQLAKAEAAGRERALVAEVERLREAGRSALAYLEGCNGLAVAVPIGMLRAALAQHESKEASDGK